MASRVGRLPPSPRIKEAHPTAGGPSRAARRTRRPCHGPVEGIRLIRRSLPLVALFACAHPAYAQGPIQFFPRYDFHLGAERLSQSDPRFVWDTNFGGDMDFVDYGRGRATFAANYEAVLGKEFRAFDPNQGDYLLDTSLSGRVHGYEFAALLHHTSRHLGDRFKRIPVAWNMFGVTAK